MQQKIISIANTKGGTGKSTITLFLAKAIRNQTGKKVLIVDMDEQASIIELHKIDSISNPEKILFDVIPSTYALLKKDLNKFAPDYDVILIDPPRYTDSTNKNVSIQAIKFSDFILIPLTGTLFDINATINFLEIIKAIIDDARQNEIHIKYNCVLNRVNDRIGNQQTIQYLNANNYNLFSSTIKDLALLQNVDCYNDLMNTKQGKQALEPFFNEFRKWTKI